MRSLAPLSDFVSVHFLSAFKLSEHRFDMGACLGFLAKKHIGARQGVWFLFSQPPEYIPHSIIAST
jgi:hypothetical protein